MDNSDINEVEIPEELRLDMIRRGLDPSDFVCIPVSPTQALIHRVRTDRRWIDQMFNDIEQIGTGPQGGDVS